MTNTHIWRSNCCNEDEMLDIYRLVYEPEYKYTLKPVHIIKDSEPLHLKSQQSEQKYAKFSFTLQKFEESWENVFDVVNKIKKTFKIVANVDLGDFLIHNFTKDTDELHRIKIIFVDRYFKIEHQSHLAQVLYSIVKNNVWKLPYLYAVKTALLSLTKSLVCHPKDIEMLPYLTPTFIPKSASEVIFDLDIPLDVWESASNNIDGNIELDHQRDNIDVNNQRDNIELGHQRKTNLFDIINQRDNIELGHQRKTNLFDIINQRDNVDVNNQCDSVDVNNQCDDDIKFGIDDIISNNIYGNTIQDSKIGLKIKDKNDEIKKLEHKNKFHYIPDEIKFGLHNELDNNIYGPTIEASKTSIPIDLPSQCLLNIKPLKDSGPNDYSYYETLDPKLYGDPSDFEKFMENYLSSEHQSAQSDSKSKDNELISEHQSAQSDSISDSNDSEHQSAQSDLKSKDNELISEHQSAQSDSISDSEHQSAQSDSSPDSISDSEHQSTQSDSSSDSSSDSTSDSDHKYKNKTKKSIHQKIKNKENNTLDDVKTSWPKRIFKWFYSTNSEP